MQPRLIRFELSFSPTNGHNSSISLKFYADANEAESWLKERQALVESRDLGQDEPSAQALLQRHKDLEGELSAYQGDVDTLNAQADALLSAGISKLEVTVFFF
jgi:spectrin beta